MHMPLFIFNMNMTQLQQQKMREITQEEQNALVKQSRLKNLYELTSKDHTQQITYPQKSNTSEKQQTQPTVQDQKKQFNIVSIYGYFFKGVLLVFILIICMILYQLNQQISENSLSLRLMFKNIKQEKSSQSEEFNKQYQQLETEINDMKADFQKQLKSIAKDIKKAANPNNFMLPKFRPPQKSDLFQPKKRLLEGQDNNQKSWRNLNKMSRENEQNNILL